MRYRFVLEETTDSYAYKVICPLLAHIGATLESLARRCRTLLPGRFVYIGGHHIAIHKDHNDPTRIALIVEEES